MLYTTKTEKRVEPKVDGSILKTTRYAKRRSQWPHGLRRRFVAARLLRLWVRIPPGRGGAWISVCCVVR